MYEIGQVLYVISQRERRVFPVRVVEQVTRKSLDGIKEQYWVELPRDAKTVKDSKPQVLDAFGTLGEDVFDTLDDVRMYMLSNATKMIDETIATADRIASERFAPPPVTAVVVEPTDEALLDNDNMKTTVTLDDGTVARFSIPEVLGGESTGT